MITLLSLAAALVVAAPADDYQQKADAASWEWRSADQSGLLYSLQTAPRELEITVTRPKDTFGDLTVRVALDDKNAVTWTGHINTPFVVNDKTLYYADYNPFSSGCTVIAYDLTNGKQLWKTGLQGLGPIAHTKYHNAVQIDFFGDALRVYGDESAGKYLEYVDLKTGKTVGHKLFQ